MFKKIFDFVTAPIRAIIAIAMLIYVAFAIAFDQEAQRELDDFNGIREGE